MLFQLAYCLCLVGSTNVYLWPGLGVGGSGLPLVPVISVRVVVLRYWPERGAGVPGVSLLLVMMTSIQKLRIG